MTSRQSVAREEVAKLHAFCERVVSDCGDQLIRKSELQGFTADVREKLQSVLDKDTRAFRVFDRMREDIGSYWVNHNTSPYAERRDCEYAQKWLDLLAAVMRELDPSAAAATTADQHTLRAGDVYGSIRAILRVMKTATKELTIVDPHLDSSIFDYIDELDDHLELQLLTGSTPKPMFLKLLAELRKSRPHVQAHAAGTKLHDRFVILDYGEIWQLGCSFNGVGAATSTFNHITEATAKAELLDEFKSAWKQGTAI